MTNENGQPRQTLEERLKNRGRDYFAFMKCPMDGANVQVAGDTVICANGHHHYSRDGVIFLVDSDQRDAFDQTATHTLADYQSRRWAQPDEETFKRLPQTSLDGWPLGYWQKRAFATAELWRFLENLRREADMLPIGDLGTVADLTDGLGWLGYGADVAGYTVLVVGENATIFGLDAYPYARYPRIQGSLTDPPLATGQYDVVLYSFSLHLIDDKQQALKNGAALLKPGGHMVVLLAEKDINGVDLVKVTCEAMDAASLEVHRQRVRGMGNMVRQLFTLLSGGPGVPPLIIGRRV